MKKSEALIQKISEQFRVSPATSKAIYEAVNKYDWECFCSQMGDYDHPEERTAALKKLNSFKGCYSPHFQKTINEIQAYMEASKEYNIHEMDKEMEDK